MPNARKVTVASDWLAGCAGCHMSFLDMDEKLVELLGKVELTATPITDFKHPAEPAAGGVDVGLLEGCVNNSATEETARRMRRCCRTLIALGDCAVFGGVPTMRNVGCQQAALRRAYVESESTVDGKVPADPELAVSQRARALGQVVDVDVNLPGCPPSPEAIVFVLSELLAGRKPELKGKFLDWH